VVVTNISEAYVNSFDIEEQSVIVLSSVIKGLYTLYIHYTSRIFMGLAKSYQTVATGMNGRSQMNKTSQSLIKPVLTVLRDFEVCPFILNQKTSFLIWIYSGVKSFKEIPVQTRA